MESLISDYRSFLFVICGCLRFEQNGMRLPLGIVILVCVSLDSLSQLNIPHFWIHVSNGWTPLLHLIAMCRLEITRYCEFKKTRSIPIGIATLLTYENLHDFVLWKSLCILHWRSWSMFMGELYFGCICCTSSIVGNDPGCIVQRNPFFLFFILFYL